jgi:hypothetical protein
MPKLQELVPSQFPKELQRHLYTQQVNCKDKPVALPTPKCDEPKHSLTNLTLVTIGDNENVREASHKLRHRTAHCGAAYTLR